MPCRAAGRFGFRQEYVQSKEALLELAARCAMDPGADLDPQIPPATPAAGAVHRVAARLAGRARHVPGAARRGALDREPGGAGAAEPWPGETGRVITAAGLIMVLVFLSFVLINDSLSIQEVGFGFAVAIVIYAFSVRASWCRA